jgi:hypothetical protein
MLMRVTRRAIMDQGVLLLLELLPTTQLIANPLASPLLDIKMPGLDFFGPYPILQFGIVLIAFIMTVAGLLGWRKGEKIGREQAAAASVPVAELHFDGPIKGMFDGLNDIKARQLLARLEIKDDVAILLSQMKTGIVDKLAAVQSDIRDCIGDAVRDQNAQTENRVRDLANNLHTVHERIDELMRVLATIEDRLPRKAGRG